MPVYKINFQTMLCTECKTNEATIHQRYGVLPCPVCRSRQSTLVSPHKSVEFTTQDIKESRKVYYNDVLQPHRKGELSKEWVEVYGKEAAKKRGFTDQEIAKAKYVWSGDDGVSYYKKGN